MWLLHAHRLVIAAATLTTVLSAGEVDPPDLRPSRGPEPRTLQFAPMSSTRSAAGVDAAGLSADIAALKRALERVRSAIDAGQAGDDQARADLRAWAAGKANQDNQASTQIPPKPSARYGARLVFRADGAEWGQLDAALSGEPLNDVLAEIALITGRSVDQLPGALGRRPVSLRVRDLPLDEAFDRLLGQAGLTWRPDGKSVLAIDPKREPPTPADRDAAARRALERATIGSDERAAEALWRLGRRDLDAGRPVEALRRAGALIDRFAAQREPALRTWAMRGLKLNADAMMALNQLAEARIVLRTYRLRALAERDDEQRERIFPDLAAVYLSGADAAQRLGSERADPVAFAEAADELHQFLERYGERPALAAGAAAARLTLGKLLIKAGRWSEAETQLKRHVLATAGGANRATEKTVTTSGHHVQFWLAECAYRQGHPEAAAPIYEQLLRWYRAGITEAPSELYADAGEKFALCLVDREQPLIVEGLLAFIAWRREFRGRSPSPEALVATARCYAELERDDQAVKALWDLLKTQGAADDRASKREVDRLLADLIGRTREYAGPVRAKVLFYMAQANWRIAERDRSNRAAAATDAAGFYQRVIDENPPDDLRQSARIGLARAALAAGQDERGVAVLTALLSEVQVAERDRQLCAQLLGDHYRAKGLVREAIRAYRGEVGP